ncbi:MAG TPA: 4Fe-4S binding protein, partial [Candidatus Brocadiaceae bacterium]
CHHKFKIGFSGCPIDCTRTREMDLGFQGVVYPVWNKDLCNGCTLCAKACLEGAIVSDKEGRPMFDESKCVYCGDCIRGCPTDAWKDKKKGWLVRTGGKHGRHPREADQVANFLPDNKVNDFISATLKWYKENGKPKERIGSCIDRVGLDKFKKEVANLLTKTS